MLLNAILIASLGGALFSVCFLAVRLYSRSRPTAALEEAVKAIEKATKQGTQPVSAERVDSLTYRLYESFTLSQYASSESVRKVVDEAMRQLSLPPAAFLQEKVNAATRDATPGPANDVERLYKDLKAYLKLAAEQRGLLAGAGTSVEGFVLTELRERVLRDPKLKETDFDLIRDLNDLLDFAELYEGKVPFDQWTDERIGLAFRKARLASDRLTLKVSPPPNEPPT